MSVWGLILIFEFTALMVAADSDSVVAKVNGKAITYGDVEFAAVQQGVTDADRAKAEPQLVDRLIERQLIRGFLAAKKIEPRADDLELQIAKAEETIKKQGEDPKKFLGKLGYTPARLKSELGLTLAWQAHVRKTVTAAQLKSYFDQHRFEFDGTQLRARQIFLKLPKPSKDDETAAKLKILSDLRQQIIDQKLTFAGAAEKHSEAPTRDRGGDVGLFSWQGKLPAPVSHAAFALKVDEISEPIVSQYGIHLIQVTERHPGDFSIEDVRPVLMDRLSQQMWKETVEKERATAKIERELIK